MGITNTCLFTNSHDAGHSSDRKFHVRFSNPPMWEDLTEAEILSRGPLDFMHASDWDFWWDEERLPGEVVPQHVLDYRSEMEGEVT